MSRGARMCVLVLLVLCVAVSTAAAADKVTFVMSWAPDARWAAEFLAKERGYFAQEGLEVTFVNQRGRIQRIGRAFPPLPDSREDWSILLELARQLNHPLAWRNPSEIFLGLAQAVAPFAGWSYETIGSQGVETAP